MHSADLSKIEGGPRFKKGLAIKMAIKAGVCLKDCDLSKADLREADLRDADLSGADCTYANFTNANLIGADLSKAELTGVTLIGSSVGSAKKCWQDIKPLKDSSHTHYA